jgi:RNA polymerase sigma-32 factor
LINNYRLVKLGKTDAQRKLFFRLRREQQKLSQEGCYTSQDLAEALGVTEGDVDYMDNRLSAPEVSLNASSNTGREDNTLIDSLPSGEDLETDAIQNNLVNKIRAKMIEFEQRLTGLDLAVWNARIAPEDPDTFDMVGKLIGKTRQRVQQIEAGLKTRFAKFANMLG